MWLHAQPLNQARSLPVTALWPWGAQGATVPPGPAAATAAPAAFAADAYVRGLWHICGRECRAVPEALGAVLDSGSERAALVVEAGVLLQGSSEGFGAALAQLDARYLVPAVQALRAGALGLLRLIANDRCLTVRARSALKVWRRVPAALEALT